MRRPNSFNDIIGHDWLVNYLETHLRNQTVPQFLILEGPEGLGKTSIADLIAISLVYGLDDSGERRAAVDSIVNRGESNDYIKKFKCSVEGGRDAAKNILAELTNSFMLGHNKVILCDECHNLSKEAQDVFLSDTEFMKKGVYLIMMTTDIQQLRASLVSRAVQLHLYPLKHKDMMTVLRREVAERRLRIQNEEGTLSLICEWSECHPRNGLSMLNAFADGDSVSSNMIRDMIGVLDVSDVLPVLESLSSSMVFGLNYIADMKIDDSIIPLVSECFKVKSGNPSYKIQMSQISDIKQRLREVTEEQLIMFLKVITSREHVSRSLLINAFISAHSSKDLLGEKNTNYLLRADMDVKTAKGGDNIFKDNTVPVVTLRDLLNNSDVVSEGN